MQSIKIVRSRGGIKINKNWDLVEKRVEINRFLHSMEEKWNLMAVNIYI